MTADQTVNSSHFRKRKKTNYLTYFKNPSFLAGSVIVLFMLVLAFFPETFATHDPIELDGSAMLQAPSAAHFFGTDNYGRDIYSRVIHATGTDLALSFFGTVVPFIIGVTLGILTGYYGGLLDNAVMRVLDVMMAFPFTVLVITIMSVLGPGLQNVYISLWLVGWMTFCRLTRAETMVFKNSEFVQAARVAGFTDRRIILRHLLPNVVSPAIVYMASEMVFCLLTAASMSFLGLGIQPPAAEWGSLLNTGRGFISFAWWMTVFPGIFLAVTGIGLSLIGDGLTDFLRTKGR